MSERCGIAARYVARDWDDDVPVDAETAATHPEACIYSSAGLSDLFWAAHCLWNEFDRLECPRESVLALGTYLDSTGSESHWMQR